MGKELTSNSPEDAAAAGALGGDFDGDGLSNEYENARPGMNPNSVDSDGDGLDDKLETQTLGTDPAKADTDADGLTDSEEINVVKTDPLNPDTDYDGLNDYDEAILLATDPLRMDTDQDGLTDYYEANHKYNMTGITPSVTEVIIGGISYPDRTDPLVPDTDGEDYSMVKKILVEYTTGQISTGLEMRIPRDMQVIHLHYLSMVAIHIRWIMIQMTIVTGNSTMDRLHQLKFHLS
jgi:hypothetical protein